MHGILTRRGLVAGTLTAALAIALASCSSGGGSEGTGSGGSGSGGSGSGGSGTTAHSSAPATKAAASHKKVAGALSGKWSGHYNGSFTGNFTVRWHQTGAHLHGTIHISNPGNTMPINGIVHGSAISFGTVGSMAITYSGTVSGNSMSGTYKVHGANGASGGPWSASRA
jgi:hypothetical protein